MAQAFRTQNLRLLASILDANDNELIKSPSLITSAVNELTISNAATTVSPSISATGDDANISLNLISKGTGNILINGKAISLANSFTTAGNFSLSFTTTGNTSLTLPTSGTLATTSQIPTVYDNTLTLAGSGGVSVSATPTFTANASADKTITITIADAALTLGKLANIGGFTILGNSSPSSAGAPAALSIATVASMLSNQTMNIVGTATSVTDIVLVAKGGTGVATANANAIFVGPASGSAAAPSFRAMVTEDIPTGIVTYAKIQYVANTARVLGRISSLSGEIEELTGANIVTVIDTNAVARATNLAGGIAGQIPYQSGANTTAFSAAGTASQVLLSGAAGAPTWASQSSLSVGSATTAGSVTNALTISSPLTGTSYNGSAAISIGLPNASDTVVGAVSIGAQTFGGSKTFKDDVIVSGNLTVNGTTITINSSTLSVDDKNIELGAVIAIASLSSTSDITAASNIVDVTSTSGLIVGQALTKISGTGAFGTNPIIASIVSPTQFTVSPVHVTTGSIVFSVSGATDITADTGGITLKGATDKTFNWLNATSSWTSSENLDIVTGKTYKINNVGVLSSTTLGSSVVNSSLTSVGTLVNLTVTNAINGSVTGSAASLSTPHTFWGQTFNGTQDVSGNLTSVGNITGSSGLTITAGGSNQNVVLTPSGTGYTLLNGNVGIGTTSPKQKLDIAGAGAGSIALTNTGTSGYSEVIFYEGSSVKGDIWVNGSAQSNYAGANSLNILQNSNAPMAFYTNGSNERMRIDGGGNVGIGTTSVLAKFVVSNGSGENIEFTTGNATVNGGLIESINRSTGTTRPDLNLFTSGASNGSIKFYTNGVNERMRVHYDGNVGIGTIAPAAKLHINSTTSGAALLRADGTNGTLFSVVDDLSDSLMSVNNSAGLPVLEVFADDRIVAGQYGQNDFVVINNKIGIGIASPVNKLSVIGSASIGDSTYNVSAPTNGLIVQGNVGIGTVSPTNGTLQVYNASGNTLSLQKSGGAAALAIGSETTVYALIESINTGGIKFYTGNGSQTERWKITSAGILESNGAQTIRTSIDSLTLATNANNGNIILSPHGNGNVGIGDTTTTAKLDVNGTARIRTISASGSAGTIFLTTDGTGILISRTAAEVRSDIGAGTGNGTVTGVTASTPLAATAGNAPVISLSGIVPIANGGTGAATAQLAINALAGAVTTAQFLRGNGTNVLMSAIQAADVPVLNQNTTGTAAGLSAVLAIASGGTGAATAQLAINALAGAVTTAQFLRGNGTNVLMSAIQAADVPVLNQNTTGTAAGLSAVLAIASGGTGVGTTIANAFFAGPDGSTGAPSFRAMVSADIPNSIVSYSKIQNVSATARVLGRITALAGVVEELTGANIATIIGANAVTNATNATTAATCTGNAASATVLATARTIGGVSFDGSAAINLPGVNEAGTQNTSGTAAGLSAVLAIASGGTGAATAAINTIFAGPSSGATGAPSFRIMAAADIPTSIISYAKIQNVNPNTVLGRITAGVGIVEELSGANIAAIIGSSAITNASNVTIATDDTTNSSYYLYFGENITGNTPLKGSTKIRYNPSTGAFSATTKSFRIPHPTKPQHDLVYGSLESPYHGVRLTGKGKTKGNRAEIFLPDYVKSLIDEETVNIQLTVIKCAKILYIENIIIHDNKFTVKYDKSWYEKSKDVEFYWDFTAERKDVAKLIVEEKL